MIGNDCFNTPWVKELRQAAELYCVDESKTNLRRVRMVLVKGIYQNEKLPLAGIDRKGFFTASKDSIRLLYVNLFPQEDVAVRDGASIFACFTLIVRNRLDGLLFVTEHGSIAFPLDDLATMFKALYGDTDGKSEGEEDAAPDEGADSGEPVPEDSGESDPEESETEFRQIAYDDFIDDLDENEAAASDFLVKRPLPEAHFEPIHQALSNALMPDGGKVLVRFTNYIGDDGLLALLAIPADERFHVLAFFSMEDFGWKHPLVLGCGLGPQATINLFRTLCCTERPTDEVPEFQNFRDETSLVYEDD